MYMRNKHVAILAMVTGLLIHVEVDAATEYLRLEGNISADYLVSINDNIAHEFSPSQPLIFDIRIDTELASSVIPGNDFFYLFQSTLLGGSVGPGELLYGEVGRTVEYVFAGVTLTNDLYASGPNITCDEENPLPICSVADVSLIPFYWEVGTEIDLVTRPSAFPDGFLPSPIGSLTLTYRSSTPIPVPGAFGLFLSAMLFVGWRASTRK